MDIAGFSVRNWQFTLVMLLMLMALGFQALRDIPRSEDPELNAPNYAIIAVFPGATPTDVESLVVDPLEARLSSLGQLERMKTNIDGNVAFIALEFEIGAVDPEQRYGDVVREVNAARTDLPEDVARLEVIELRPTLVNAFEVALVAPNASTSEIEATTDEIQARLETVPGVNKVTLTGLPDRELRVSLDTDALAALEIPLGRVLDAIHASSVRIPGGSLDVGKRRFDVSIDSALTRPDELLSTAIGAGPTGVVRLGDVARIAVQDADNQPQTRFNGGRAVFLAASVKTGENLFAVRDGVVAAVESFEGRLPPGMSLHTGFDQSRNVSHRLEGFTRDFAIAIGLVLLTLLPLGLRASGVVMISIPLSLSIGLALLNYAGFTINQLSIVGFVVALGLLVDDSIVVVENIARHLRNGSTRTEAAIEGTRQITLAVIGCTATLIFAFLPLLFLPGAAGLFIRSLPTAVVFTILASLLVSLTVVPLLASLFLRETADEHGNVFLRALTRAIEVTYGPILRLALRFPKATLALATLLFVGSVALVPVVGFSLFPKAGIPQVLIRIDAPDGASVAETDAAARYVEQILATRPEVETVMTNVGIGNPRIYYNVDPAPEAPDRGELFVILHHFDAEETPVFFDWLRDATAAWPGADITVHEFENGPPVDAPVAIRLYAEDIEKLGVAASRVEALLEATAGTVDVRNPLRLPRTDLRVAIDRDRAARLGVPVAEIARAVRFGVAGLDLGAFREADGEEIPIRARLSGGAGVERFARLYVASVAGPVLPLSSVANVAFAASPARINHVDRQRAVTVGAGVRTGFNTDSVTKDVLARLPSVQLPDGVRWEAAGELESRQESFSGIGAAAIIAAFGILAVLVLEFKTFRSTLVVASVIPLGLTGGILGLLVTGNTLSFTAAIGFVALVGIEVKNSILLVDFTNQLRSEGVGLDEAIDRAGKARFVPILLTTATALGGLVPLALENSSLYSPLAIVIIGGLLSSTVLTRLITPVLYKLLAPAVDVVSGPVPGVELAAMREDGGP